MPKETVYFKETREKAITKKDKKEDYRERGLKMKE
jgi:hypothetical protein